MVQKLAHHVEVGKHVWIIPLLVESKRSTGEAGDENDGGVLGVTSSLRPDLGTVGRVNVDRERGNGERESSEKWSKLHDDA